MAEKTVVISVPPGKSIKVVKWKVRKGVFVSIGQIILLYKDEGDNGDELKKLKACEAGTVRALAAVEGEAAHPGDRLCELEECSHPTVMKDMCAECGADLRNDDIQQSNNKASVPMVHSQPELKVSEEVAQRLGKEDSERLLKDRKLVLLVDLDQTLVHTTNDNIPANIKDVFHFQLHGWGRWYHSRLRPGTADFLKAIASMYELHICTFGARPYAHKVARLLDPQSHLFSHRILSRDECFDIHSKTPNLRALFPCGDNLVCIIDDREDVWNRAPNLIQVRPYHFFEHTGDIHAPPGMDKTDSPLEGHGMHIEAEGNVTEAKTGSKTESPQNINNSSNSSDDLPQLDTDSTPATEVCESKEIEPIDDGATVPESAPAVGDNDVANSSIDVTKVESLKEIEDVSEVEDVNMEVDKPDSIESGKTNEVTDTKKTSEVTDEDATKAGSANVENNTSLNVDVNFGDLDPEKVLEKEIEEITSLNPDDAIVPDETDLNSDLAQELDNLEGEIPEKSNDVPESNSTTDNLIESEVPNPAVPTKWKTTEDGMIEVEDTDDYLLYLEDILKRIHKFFYQVYDAMEAGTVPDLKAIIPQVKCQVLEGTSLVFSGLVPTYQKLEHSRAYMVARSLGAQVTQDLTAETTHLVAVRPGTAKVHACRRMTKRPHLVTPGWLWSCAERWQRCDERIFPVKACNGGRGGAGSRKPPAHCASPSPPTSPMPGGAQRKRTPSGRFLDTINPLLSFSRDDIADMDKEVEDIINESDESDDNDDIFEENSQEQEELRGESGYGEDYVDENKEDEELLRRVLRKDGNQGSESESEESLSGGDHPHGWRESNRKRREREDEEEEEPPSQKFRRGEDLPSDAPDKSDSDTDGSQDPPDDIDDGEWNMMGAALEREFLGLDD